MINRRIAIEVVLLGLSIAVASATMDAFRPGAARGALQHDLSVALLASAVTAVRTLLGYLAIVAGAGLATYLASLHARAALWAVSICVALVRLVDIRSPELLLSSFLRMSATGFVVMSLAGAVYWLTSRVEIGHGAGGYLDRLTLIAPLLLGEVWLACWLLRYENDGLLMHSALLYSAGYVGLVLLTALPLLVAGRGTRAWRLLGVAVLVGALAPAVPMLAARSPVQAATVASETRPPVILITIDTLRADALSIYSDGAVQTRNIDALARDGVVFRNASSSASWTVPSVMSMMSGVSPYVHRAGFGPEPMTRTYYPGPLPMLARLLRDNGYSTKALLGNPTADLAENLRDGFDEFVVYHGLPAGWSRGSEWLAQYSPLRFAAGGNTGALTKEALEWIEENQSGRFFLWLHYLDPHWSYSPPPEYMTVSESILRRWMQVHQRDADSARKFTDEEQNEARSLYRGEVRFVDDNVGEVLEGLKRVGIYDDALILLTSDHGEEFWDHGHLGHGHSMHAETLHVPLIVKLPGGAVMHDVEEHVSTQALTPTVVDMLQLEVEEHPAWSLSLAPYLSSQPPTEPIRTPVFSAGTHRFQEMEMVIVDGVKVIHRMQSGEWFAFDLKSDPAERVDLAHGRLAATVSDARKLLEDHRMYAEEVRGGVANEKTADPAAIERLKSLGYAR